MAIGATATTAAQHTQATTAAIEARQSTVVAATAVAISTRDALTLQTTAVALQMSIDSATATADTAAAQATSAASAQQTAAAAEMAAVAIVQQDTALRLEQERQGAETRLRWLPVLYGVGIFALLALGVAGLAFVWFLLHRARYTLLHPVVELPNGRGGFGAPQLVTITAPARPAIAPPALPAPAPQPTPLPSLAGAHVLIVGPTTTGKSNVLRQVAKGLAGSAGGSAVYAIDTNYRPGAWPATVREVIGAAGDYGRVADLMAWLDEERRSRITRYAKGDAQFNPEEDPRSPQFRVPAVLPAVNSGLYWSDSSALADGLINRGGPVVVSPAPVVVSRPSWNASDSTCAARS